MNGYNLNSTLKVALSCVLSLALPALATTSDGDKAPPLMRSSGELTPDELQLLPLLFEDDMEAVHAQAKQILKRCQLPECMIVSLGTTNTLVDSFLRYYLKGESERAIHYVPIRELRTALTIPAVLERSLPQPSPGLKRVLIVRTLESGVSITVYANAVERYFKNIGMPYAIDAFFSVAQQARRVIDNLKNEDGLSPTKLKFPWAYTIEELPNSSAFDGSYRDIDRDYYRYLPVIFGREEFWKEFEAHPSVADFKLKVERSVGANKTPGPKIFELTEDVEDAWAQAQATDLTQKYEPFVLLPLFLSYHSEAAQNYAAAMTEVFKEFQYPENPNHKVLDRAVKLFIENPKLFAQKTCAALTVSHQ